MTDIILNQKVKISDLDVSAFPLCNFHVVILVEPDVETWMTPKEDEDSLNDLLEMYADLIVEEVLGEVDPKAITVPHAEDVQHTMLIMASENMGTFYFEEATEYCSFIASHNEYDFDKLRLLLDGIHKNHPDWTRVAIVGGAYEDEIIRAANAVHAAGFDTTIVKRYCVSERVFLNLDDIIEAANKIKRKLYGEDD